MGDPSSDPTGLFNAAVERAGPLRHCLPTVALPARAARLALLRPGGRYRITVVTQRQCTNCASCGQCTLPSRCRLY